MGKKKSFFDSLWFNSIMSVIAIVVLVNSIIEQSYVLVIVWVVILFHFIVVTRKAFKKKTK